MNRNEQKGIIWMEKRSKKKTEEIINREDDNHP
jgi:hypothetical protein